MAQFLACSVAAVLYTPDSAYLARLIDAVACGLSSSSCASYFWVERHIVPVAPFPLPWVFLPQVG